MGKPTVSDEQIGRALQLAQGYVTIAAEALGINTATIYKRARESEYLRDIWDEIKESRLDRVEEILLSKITQDRDVISTLFYLKCQGKKRGYVERVEHTGEDGDPIRITVEPAYRLEQETNESQLVHVRKRLSRAKALEVLPE
jgi:hypothetical protein